MSKKIEVAFQSDPVFADADSDIFIDLAYIKKEMLNNEPVWSIYNFQGEKMGYASSREMAFAVASQNEYVGSSVH